MGTASTHLHSLVWRELWPKSWAKFWQEFWQTLAPRCGHPSCNLSAWRRIRSRSGGVMIRGLRYCREECIERALLETLRRFRFVAQPTVASHRVPLGLLLLSRQQLTVEQLRAALAAQSHAGRGRIGEWLQALGFASEQQVTAALARQWSCPVLRADALSPSVRRAPQIPRTLLESFR